MNKVMTLLDEVAQQGVYGDAFEVVPGRRISFAAMGDSGASLDYQGSFDGTNWFRLSALNNNVPSYGGEFTGAVRFIRAVTGQSFSGVVTAQALQSDVD